MKWYSWRFWRLAYAPRKDWCAEIKGRHGRWKRVAGNFFVLIDRKEVCRG